MWVKPPPIYPANLYLYRFRWCQVRMVFANELMREQNRDEKTMDWREAYNEAGLVVDALQQGNQPLSIGATPDEVEWPQLVCAANAYAHKDKLGRAKTLDELASGRPVWAVLVVIAEPDLCERKALEDPEYQPEPYCIPHEAADAITMGVVTAAWSAGMVLIYRAFTQGL